ncbi:MAG: glucosamine-6-phosphate deaminase [Alphaproteobacteria bacterium]|nr:glucosamine-6-phosphate deaminase [Alphaproteobacteria bacterium]
MRVLIKPDYDSCAKWTAEYIIFKIKQFRPTANKPFVLGLPTGSSPIGVYQELIKQHKEGKISFQNVVTFNMDEYIGLPPDHPQSYCRFMWDNFFNDIDIKKENIYMLNGMTTDYVSECRNYEDAIKKVGGVNLFLCGIGTDGHIAFNEPASSFASRTRIKLLKAETIKSNSRFFGGNQNEVPAKVLTVGIGTIMDADEVLLIASGKNKQEAIRQTIECGVNHLCPASILQMHEHAIVICDDFAADKLRPDTIKYFKNIERANMVAK